MTASAGLEELLARDAARCRDPRHRTLRWLMLPAAWWSILAFGWALPVPEWLGRPGLWSALGAVALFGAAQRVSRAIALVLAVTMAAMLWGSHLLHGFMGLDGLLGVASMLLGASIVGLVVVERLEGRRPATRAVIDAMGAGPLALSAALLRRLGLSP